VGFENHGGQTKAVSNPFGKVLVGHGNTYKGKYEGYMDAQTIATYMHGPLLPKNPAIADEVILRGLNRRYAVEQLEQLQDTLENAAHDAMLKRLNVK
ncbi:MAG: glutamine amidotransferase, partial [Solobacterium sp.]|nr:glutamine amidotransferase [Solobacterium sp.]